MEAYVKIVVQGHPTVKDIEQRKDGIFFGPFSSPRGAADCLGYRGWTLVSPGIYQLFLEETPREGQPDATTYTAELFAMITLTAPFRGIEQLPKIGDSAIKYF